jgi:hypothetical protein
MKKQLINKVVRIVSDNENYSEYVGKDLIITDVVNSVRENQFYDSSMNGMYLCDLEVLESGLSVPFSLYEYEFEEV